MTTAHPLLATQALSIGYAERRQPKRIVAESLTLDLWPGQLVCLLGPNGAGKSTLMRTLAGLQPPLSGHISVSGTDLSALNTTELAQTLSLVLAERTVADNLLVWELIALGRTPYTNWLGKLTAYDHDRIQQAMQATGTLVFAQRRMGQLSDGERQKVMLARALAQDTDLILLDEPTAHLDLPNRVEMMRLLRQLTQQTQKAILLSTHELDLALQAADQLWLLDAVGNVATGTPEDLVLNGVFEATFAKEGFFFDQATGTFSMQSETQGPSVGLKGDENLVFWTRRALVREGFVVSRPNEAICVIEATTQNGGPQWTYDLAGKRHEFSTIQALLQALQTFKKGIVSEEVSTTSLPGR